MSFKYLIVGSTALMAYGISNLAFGADRIDRETYNDYASNVSDSVRDIRLRADELCVAYNVYHEARGESRKGQLAVAHVTRNRALATGKDTCSVVWKRAQFSWTIKYDRKFIEDRRAWYQAKTIAMTVMSGSSYDLTAGATHYHRHDISPRWSRAGIGKKRIGAHVFMKLKGEF